jgi:hypothetical protein
MTNDALEAALKASATAGISIAKGGIRPELRHDAPRLHPRARRVTINTSHTDKW